MRRQQFALIWQYLAMKLTYSRALHETLLCFRVKFGAFHDHLQAHHSSEFDRIASGHYAALHRSESDPDRPVRLMLTPDAIKDQTYFLASLSQAQLARCMFPLGTLTKVRIPV